jgi:DNA repair protein RadC
MKGENMNNLCDIRAPRDALMYYGAEKLSEAELLAVLIGGDASGQTDILAAYNILFKEEGGPAYIANCAPSELMRDFGIVKAAAYRIVAAVELGKRFASKSASKKIRVGSDEDAASVFMPEMRHLKNECFNVALLNIKNEIIATRCISKGGINSSLVDTREVFKSAIKHGAASILLAHNHTSGNPEPSENDKAVTLRLVRAGEILGVKVVDHIIIGDGEYFSMRKHKMMDAAEIGAAA